MPFKGRGGFAAAAAQTGHLDGLGAEIGEAL